MPGIRLTRTLNVAAAALRATIVLGVLVFSGLSAHAQEPSERDASTSSQTSGPESAASGPAAAGTPQIPECARSPDRLGISRVVEVDTRDGPIFGGSFGFTNVLQDKEVVLTFDDGPLRSYTRRVLAALEKHCTRATFFMVGRMAVADPAMVREVIAAGHTVGTHTQTHKNLAANSLQRGMSEFETGLSMISKAAGAPVAPFFRFPYLGTSNKVLDYLRTRDTATFFIDVDSKDFQTRDAGTMHARVMSGLAKTGKGIILLHDIQPSTANGIARVLDSLHEKGYKIVHLVPKAASATLADYDATAERTLSAKLAKLSDKPLADRTITWTLEDAEQPDVQAPAVAPKVSRPAVARPAAVKAPLPWTKDAPKSAPASTSKPRPATRPEDEELPWQARIFR